MVGGGASQSVNANRQSLNEIKGRNFKHQGKSTGVVTKLRFKKADKKTLTKIRLKQEQKRRLHTIIGAIVFSAIALGFVWLII